MPAADYEAAGAGLIGAFLCPMLTERRHRYLTRWNRRAGLLLVLLLLAWGLWRCWKAWQASRLVIIRGTVLAAR